jgi:hypothetical protein
MPLLFSYTAALSVSGFFVYPFAMHHSLKVSNCGHVETLEAKSNERRTI